MEAFRKSVLFVVLPAVALLVGALPAQEPFLTIEGTQYDERLGTVVRFAGDVNADGYDDLITTAPFLSWPAGGYARVYSGANGQELYEWGYWALNGMIGSVDGAGDVDADGYADVVYGAEGFNAGEVVIVSGFSGTPIHVIPSPGNSWFTGRQVAGEGDVNGDGVPDILATEFNRSLRRRRVRIHSGVDGSSLALLDPWEPSRGRFFGVAIDFLGDLDGDGCDDFVVGDSDGSSNGILTDGLAEVISGRTATTLYQLFGPQNRAQFGFAVAGVGDVNADGVPDIGVGAPLYKISSTGESSGMLRVYSGADGSVLYHIDDGDAFPVGGQSIGSSVSGAGDLDGDGYDDFLVGDESRVVAVYSGRDASVLAMLRGPRFDNSTRYGDSVTGGGDWNGDGWPDVAVGAPAWPSCLYQGCNGRGRLYLYPGNPLLTSDPLVAGTPAVVDGEYFEPGARVWLAYSLTGRGLTPLPQLALTADLDGGAVAAGPSTTDPNGAVSWTLAVPAGSQGRAVWLQAVQRGEKTLGGLVYGRKTHVLPLVVQ